MLAILVDNLFVDGDKGGVLSHEIVFETQFKNLLGDGVLVIIIIVFVQIGEIFDALASPKVTQGGVGRVSLEIGKVVSLPEGFATHFTGEGDGALRFAFVFAKNENGTFGHHVGHRDRLDVVSLEFARIELDTGKDWGVDILAETLGLGSCLVFLCYNHGFAVACKGHALDKPAIDTAADTEGKEVGLATVLTDEFEAFTFDGDIAVGENDHGAGDVLVDGRGGIDWIENTFGWPGNGVGGVEGIEDFGAAPLVGPLDEVHGTVDVLGSGIDRTGAKQGCVAGEENDVELVAGVEVGE